MRLAERITRLDKHLGCIALVAALIPVALAVACLLHALAFSEPACNQPDAAEEAACVRAGGRINL